MKIKCKLSLHDWNGCICMTCGKVRGSGHDWNRNCEKCRRCGEVRANAHDWSIDCNKCNLCSQTRLNAHSWDNFKCIKCGKTIDQLYVERCMLPVYIEQPESRSWLDTPIFQNILKPLNAGLNGIAAQEASIIVDQYPDFAPIYSWWATALMRTGSFDQARKIIVKGLNKSKRKFSICVTAGEIEWKAGNLNQAVYWWAQGFHCQESLKEKFYGNQTGVYFYLYYVSEALELDKYSNKLLNRVDLINNGSRFNYQARNEFVAWVQSEQHQDAGHVVIELMNKYMFG